MVVHRIDLNCDLGEGVGSDEAILPFITSANVACGLHAGTPTTMRRTVDAALRLGVAVGAHPGFPDPEHFGRRPLQFPPAEIRDLVLYQISALDGFVKGAGRLSHVKAHGALYTMAAGDPSLADAIAQAVRAYDPALVLFGPAGSELARAAGRAGVAFAAEAFADRAYRRDATLVPRTEPGALIDDVERAVAQGLRIVTAGTVRSTDGTDIPLEADTLCLHGDGAQAVPLARGLRQRLEATGVRITPPDRGPG